MSARKWFESVLFVTGLLLLTFGGTAMASEISENVYTGELVRFPGPWAFHIPRAHIILVSDQQLIDLTDPDREVDIGMTGTPRVTTLRKLCEQARAGGQRTLIFAFDHFFSQYRKGQEGKPRELLPDTDAYIGHIAKISKVAQEYGIGLELSLLSPLEIGKGYHERTGESGVWMHYREGLRDPRTGAFSVQFWRQTKWCNNKGPITVEDAGVRAFAFRERVIDRTPYRVVRPEDIVEITDGFTAEVWEGTARRAGDYEAVRVCVRGEGGPRGFDRVLVVQQYRTPEMDYFSDSALPFLRDLADRYADAGILLNGLYSDEMHIQQDWRYFSHHDAGQFALRYVSPGLAKRFADHYGDQYRDFAKYMVYFAYAQEDFTNDLRARDAAMHVFGDTPEAVRETALFRARYYKLLQDGVVDLFAEAKRYAESRMGHRLEARAHPTWAESPTIDAWDTGRQQRARFQYEYTPNFTWSNTVHQAASACHDFFKWNDFLTGNGNDHAEGGWIDRNYYAPALACSTGILNDVPYSYAAHWGAPGEVSRRRSALEAAYGAAGHPAHGMVQNLEHRDVDVLMLYPLDLVAVEERFGSWTTQYGYANMVPQAQILERGVVKDGAIEMAGRRFTTLAATFEPFPRRALLDMMRALAESGGRVVWSGPPPLITAEGAPALETWQALFGVAYVPTVEDGLIAPGQEVRFEGALAPVPPQTILTHFLVDRVYPVTPGEDAATVAQVGDHVAGTDKTFPGGGRSVFLGFRPRDDQARSLGYETRTWFETLDALGAYPPTGAFPDANDNTEYLSRTTDWLCCRFPNGAVSIAPHLRDVLEGWPGGFVRNPEEDAEIIKHLVLPSERIELADFQVNGHRVTYSGGRVVTFRVDEQGNLIAFAGHDAKEIAIDGRNTAFADAPMPLVAWAPVQPERRVKGGAVLLLMVHGAGAVRIPAHGLPEEMHFVAQGPTPGSRGAAISSRRDGDAFVLTIEAGASGAWLYGMPGPA